MVLSKLDVAQLAQLYVAGNEKAFPYLLQKTQAKIFNFIKVKVKDTDVANDLFQDTFFKVIQNIKQGKYNEEGKFLPWVMRIAHNLCMDYFREESKLPKHDATYGMSEDDADNYNTFDHLLLLEDACDVSIEHKELLVQIKRCIALLTAQQREIMIMRYSLNMSFKEIAIQNNMSINTVLGRMRYTMINLRNIMKNEGVGISINEK
ncbi:MAG: sigma-70 family RNA polymerase sigma factor [Bacteroidia bacterium]|nr:sigma-70 family RNA polymerase sigma factor [Bacteroidia bacterium]